MITEIIWEIEPNIFPNIEFIRWYGLCWAVGMLLSYQVMSVIYRREELSQTDLDKLTVYAIVGTILGARFGHILFYDPIYYLNNPIEILPFRLHPTFQFTGLAGLASHGGVLGVLLALYLYNRKYKMGYLWLLDRLVVAGALWGAFIRVGNLINSEIVGIPTQVPWAFVFTHIDQIPRHPTQLYEAIFYLCLSILLFFVWKSRKYQNNQGFLFGLGLTLVFIQRFLIEFLKENQVGFEEGLLLNMGQILSIPLVLIGIFMMVWSRGKKVLVTSN